MYELEHLSKWDGIPPVVFNPHNKPVEELPFIYGFCNGGQFGWMEGVLVSQDGHILGGHICSSESYRVMVSPKSIEEFGIPLDPWGEPLIPTKGE